MMKQLMLAALLGITFHQAAVAEPIILKCAITSGYSGYIADPVELYKIEGNRWLRWNPDGSRWGRDQCQGIGFFNQEDGYETSCLFSSTEFSVFAFKGGTNAKITVDRISGSIKIKIRLAPTGREPAIDKSASGSCVPAPEPVSPPPPKPVTKF